MISMATFSCHWWQSILKNLKSGFQKLFSPSKFRTSEYKITVQSNFDKVPKIFKKLYIKICYTSQKIYEKVMRLIKKSVLRFWGCFRPKVIFGITFVCAVLYSPNLWTEFNQIWYMYRIWQYLDKSKFGCSCY